MRTPQHQNESDASASLKITNRPKLWLCVPTSGKTSLASDSAILDVDSFEHEAWPAWREQKLFMSYSRHIKEYERRIAALFHRKREAGELAEVEVIVTSIATKRFAKLLGYPKFDLIVNRSPDDVVELCAHRGGWQINRKTALRFINAARHLWRTNNSYGYIILDTDQYVSDVYDEWQGDLDTIRIKRMARSLRALFAAAYGEHLAQRMAKRFIGTKSEWTQQ